MSAATNSAEVETKPGVKAAAAWDADFRAFFHAVAQARESALLLDFDGTLASFRIDPSAVRPWAGVSGLLDEIHQAHRTKIAIVSGRPAREVAAQLGMQAAPDIWGLHGAERLSANGLLERQNILPEESAKLAAARIALEDSRLISKLGLRQKDKENAVVVHWRGISEAKAKAAEQAVAPLLEAFAQGGRMHLLRFDGGLELRAGHNKGDAVRLLLTEICEDAPAAYLGDDTTDEDAFQALGKRGLSVLVRRQRRPSAAQAWLRPPHELRQFLRSWVDALGKGGLTS